MPVGTPLGNANATTTGTASTLSTTIPAGASAGDTAYLITALSTGSLTCTTPTGWTLVTPPAGSTNPIDDGSSSMRTYLFTRTVTASGTGSPGSSVSVTWSGAGRL